MNDKVFWMIAYEIQFPRKKLILVNMIYKTKGYTLDIFQGKQLRTLLMPSIISKGLNKQTPSSKSKSHDQKAK